MSKLSLSVVFSLLKELWDFAHAINRKRKIKQRKQRRQEVKNKPADAFARLFGKPANDSVHEPATPDTSINSMHTNLPTNSVDKNGKRKDNL